MALTHAEIERLQSRLVELGYSPGPIDGDWGDLTQRAVEGYLRVHLIADPLIAPDANPVTQHVVTVDSLRQLCPGGRRQILEGVAQRFQSDGARFGLVTPLRICHFLAQAAHESDHFKTTREYWGPTVAQRGYEGRSDLGNDQPGDGKNYMGRGIFQLTGRANYREFGVKIGMDLEANPQLAEEPSVSTLLAFHYWRDRGCNALADADDVRAVTKRINGGYNGLDDRKEHLARAKEIWM